jgi:hypothetical protein
MKCNFAAWGAKCIGETEAGDFGSGRLGDGESGGLGYDAADCCD